MWLLISQWQVSRDRASWVQLATNSPSIWQMGAQPGKRGTSEAPVHPLHQGFSAFGVHQNHTERFLKQIPGLQPQSFDSVSKWGEKEGEVRGSMISNKFPGYSSLLVPDTTL